jgi:hypothetical protein
MAGPGNPQFAMKADHAVRIAVTQGPNLNRLGVRRPERCGTETLADVTSRLDGLAARLGVELQHTQSNHEGELIDWLHERMDVDAVIVNPAGLTRTGARFLTRFPMSASPSRSSISHSCTGTTAQTLTTSSRPLPTCTSAGSGRWVIPPRSAARPDNSRRGNPARRGVRRAYLYYSAATPPSTLNSSPTM